MAHSPHDPTRAGNDNVVFLQYYATIRRAKCKVHRHLEHHHQPLPPNPSWVFDHWMSYGPNDRYWLIAHRLSYGFIAATFGDEDSGYEGEITTWGDPDDPPIPPLQVAELNAEYAVHQSRVRQWRHTHAEAARKDAERYLTWPTTGSTPYLDRTQVPAYGCYINDHQVFIPFRVLNTGELWGGQLIEANGYHRLLPGTPLTQYALCHLIGGGRHDPKITALCLVADYATGALWHQATAQPVIIAGYAHHLPRVAQAIAEHWPQAHLTIALDPEHSARGRHYARQAQAAHGQAEVTTRLNEGAAGFSPPLSNRPPVPSACFLLPLNPDDRSTTQRYAAPALVH